MIKSERVNRGSCKGGKKGQMCGMKGTVYAKGEGCEQQNFNESRGRVEVGDEAVKMPCAGQ